MSRVHELLGALLKDAASIQSTTVSYHRDLETMKSRLAHEGLSFLTITLPSFVDEIFISVEQGQVTSDLFIGWKKRLCLPAFLQGFTRLVFDATTGRLLDNANTNALSAIRQIGYFFKKVKLPCTEAREKFALKRYVRTDLTLDSLFDNLTRYNLNRFSEIADLVVGSLFNDYHPFSILVHHGPGATADHRGGNQKYVQSNLKYFRDLTPYFPPGHGILYNSEESQSLDQNEIAMIDVKLPVHVTLVPKTLKTPRVIAMEPTTMLLIQQGIKDYLVEKIEGHSLTKGHLNFANQKVNADLALQSSRSKELATLDLSDASDRVHNELVKLMFDSNQELCRDLQLTRAEQALVGNELIDLNKFASMGSALCFPVESLFFYIVILTARSLCCGRQDLPVTLSLIKALTRDIFVYGDDLIVPVNEVEHVVSMLSNFGNIVGLRKSFWKSSFRESCGTDAYMGNNITPIYLRQLPPNNWSDTTRVVSVVATHNLLFNKGYCETASILKQSVVEVIGDILPTFLTVDEREGLYWIGTSERLVKRRFNVFLQRHEVQSLVPFAIMKNDRISGYPALFKTMLNMERKTGTLVNPEYDNLGFQVMYPPSVDTLHLEQTAKRYVLGLKRRWVPLQS